jgi:hypothetical protein
MRLEYLARLLFREYLDEALRIHVGLGLRVGREREFADPPSSGLAPSGRPTVPQGVCKRWRGLRCSRRGREVARYSAAAMPGRLRLLRTKRFLVREKARTFFFSLVREHGPIHLTPFTLVLNWSSIMVLPLLSFPTPTASRLRPSV